MGVESLSILVWENKHLNCPIPWKQGSCLYLCILSGPQCKAEHRISTLLTQNHECKIIYIQTVLQSQYYYLLYIALTFKLFWRIEIGKELSDFELNHSLNLGSIVISGLLNLLKENIYKYFNVKNFNEISMF